MSHGRDSQRCGTEHTGPKWCRRDAEGLELQLQLRLQPRASSTGIVEATHSRLRVRVSAPAVNNAANQALCVLLAKQFRVPVSRVRLLSGTTAREKRVRVERPRAEPDWLRG